MLSDGGQIFSDVRESPDDRSRFSQDCTAPGRVGRVLPRRTAGFSCRRQEICFAGLASRGVRKSVLTLEQQTAFVEEAPEIFCRFLAAGERLDTGIFAWRRRARMYCRAHSEQR